jgi:hypothetical protein
MAQRVPPPSRVSCFNEDSFSLENFKSNGLTIALISIIAMARLKANSSKHIGY